MEMEKVEVEKCREVEAELESSGIETYGIEWEWCG